MTPFEHLCTDYWDWYMASEPVYATYLGDFRFNDRLPDLSDEARQRHISELEALQSRASAVAADTLDEQDRVSLDILQQALRDQIEERSHHFEEWALDQLMGPQVWLQELLNYHPLDTPEYYRDLIGRYRRFSEYMDDYLANLRRGVASGRTAPTVAVDRVKGQLRDLLAVDPAASPLMPAPDQGPEGREVLRAETEAALRQSVYPAFQRLLDCLDAGYPGRESFGVSALPGGDDAYRFRIRRNTTTSLGAEEIHAIGLAMLESTLGEMRALAARTGHSGTVVEFMESLRADPSNFPASRGELLEGYRAILAEVDALLPRWFGRLPKVRCVVKPIEEFRERDCVTAYYYSPPDDFSRDGVFYANTYQPERRPRYQMVALTLHEAVPGHHLQIALAMEQRNLPAFRRHADFNAYIEGWALYTERLGVEMGAYHDDLSLFGMLMFQAWRVSRLVVDTGMHALGWSRERAIQFFRDNVGLPENEIVNEIDRYIIWPGQALSYALGMREIQRLRREAEERLGDRFDLKAFHDEILRFGAVPLATLEKIVTSYVERTSAAAVRH